MNRNSHYRIDPAQESDLEFWIPKHPHKKALLDNLYDDWIVIVHKDKIILKVGIASQCSLNPYDDSSCKSHAPAWFPQVPMGTKSPSIKQIERNSELQGSIDKLLRKTVATSLGKQISLFLRYEKKIIEILGS